VLCNGSQDLRFNLAEELNFEQEGRNLERCRRDLSVLPYVYLPQVDWQLTSKRVLTAEWIDGCRVTDKAAIHAMGLDVADVRTFHIMHPCVLIAHMHIFSLLGG
jgi:aarF domain-containing kinase